MWFSKEAEDFFRGFNPCEVCTHECSNDEKNQILNEFVDCEGEGVKEFI